MPMPNRTHGPIAVAPPTVPEPQVTDVDLVDESESVLKTPWYLRIGWLTLIVVWARLAWDILDPYPLAGFCAAAVGFCLPGWALLRWFWGGWPGQRGNAGHWIVGAALGLTISSFAASVEGYLVGAASGWSVIVLDAISLFVLAVSANRPARPPESMIRPWTFAEQTVLWGALFAVTLFIIRPITCSGELTEFGYAYPWLIVERLYGHASLAANGLLGLPPPYLHLAGETLHAPMAGYMLPLAGQIWFDPVGDATAWVTMWSLFLALLFVAFLVVLFRRLTRSVTGMLGMSALAFACYGFHWLVPGIFGSDHRLARGSGMSHGLYRIFLAEPTALLAILVLLTGGLLLYRTRRLSSKRAGFALGAMLGITIGIDEFWGIVALAAMIIAAIAEFRAVRRGWSILAVRWFYAYLGFGLTAVVFTLSGMLEGLPAPDLQLEFSVSRLAQLPIYIFVELGALLFFGIVGVVLRWRHGHHGTLVVVLLFALVALSVMMFMQTAANEDFGVVHGGRLLLLTLLAAGAGCLTSEALELLRRRRTLLIVLTVVALVAVPTVFVDYAASGATDNPHHTFYLSATDRRAMDWIRIALPPDRIIQGHPRYFNYTAVGGIAPSRIAIIPLFAGRPMYVGAWQMPDHPYDADRRWQHARRQVTALFTGDEPRKIAQLARAMQIEYIYIGPLERLLYPTLEHHLQSDIQFFERVYFDREDPQGVSIYRVL